MAYRRYEAAVARVEALKKAGIWPALIMTEGGWRLSYDPPSAVGELDSHGYLQLGTDMMTDG